MIVAHGINEGSRVSMLVDGMPYAGTVTQYPVNNSERGFDPSAAKVRWDVGGEEIRELFELKRSA